MDGDEKCCPFTLDFYIFVPLAVSRRLNKLEGYDLWGYYKAWFFALLMYCNSLVGN